MKLDPELLEGARSAIRVCMGVKAKDRVLILTDEDTALVGEALLHEALGAGAVAETICLEEYGSRPMPELPGAVLSKLGSFSPSVTYLAISAWPGELPMRGRFVGAALARAGTRHAHMPTITPAIMREGMRADYNVVNRLTAAVHNRLQQAKHIRVQSAKGTEIHGHFTGRFKWTPFGGLYHRPGEWGNLPEGEVFTCPDSVDGVLVADVIGDYFAQKYGVLGDPVKIEFEKGYARKIECANKELQRELWDYLSSKENGLRVGEFAVGTNVGVRALRGNVLQDEKIPGLHIGVGDPLGKMTGADWYCDAHVDLIPSACTIFLDGELLMEEGRFAVETQAAFGVLSVPPRSRGEES
jgi:aminopeptidase